MFPEQAFHFSVHFLFGTVSLAAAAAAARTGRFCTVWNGAGHVRHTQMVNLLHTSELRPGYGPKFIFDFSRRSRCLIGRRRGLGQIYTLPPSNHIHMIRTLVPPCTHIRSSVLLLHCELHLRTELYVYLCVCVFLFFTLRTLGFSCNTAAHTYTHTLSFSAHSCCFHQSLARPSFSLV